MRPLSLGFDALLAASAVAQFSNWQPHQINTTICSWKQPRAALLRDTVYLDGGTIWWSPGLDSGEAGTAVNHGNFQGLVLAYNLSEPFSPDSNVTGILLEGSKANDIRAKPNAYDGGMLANHAEFFLYGGAVLRTGDTYTPAADEVLEYQAYQYGPDRLPLWQKGLREARLNGNVTRYIAYGAPVSAPSENKAWYFSGLTSPTRGQIDLNTSLNGSTRAMNISNTLITLDMTTQLDEKWSNSTLPDNVKGRSNAEVVWVPVGKQGILVVLGGVTYPEWATDSHKSENAAASERESSVFMRDIDIYDVSGNRWYKQPTKDGPGTRSRGCAVVAPAADHSSFNIYYYGGFDGIHPKDDFYDDVWILSLPSFSWTQINKGTAIHGRAGHKCFIPYPDQMMAFGGYAPEPGSVPSCLDKGPVVVFNMTSGEWMDSYDPTRYGQYGVHEKVRAAIGGDASGGATVTTPVPSGWAATGLADVFAQSYDTKKITTYWPYAAAPTTGRPDLHNDNGGDGGVKKSIIIPAVVVPLVFLAGVGIIAWRCCMHRSKSGSGSSKYSGSDDTAMRIRMWIRGQDKSIIVTSSDPASPSQDVATPSPVGPLSSEVVSSVHHEMADTQLAELGDTSPPAELHGTGLSPMNVVQRHARFSQAPVDSPTDPARSSTWRLGDNTDPVCRASVAPDSARRDSAVLENMPRLHGITQRPEAAASAGGSTSAGRKASMAEDPKPLDTPAARCPPSSEEMSGSDSSSVSEMATGPAKKSIFQEHDEEMGSLK